MKTKIAAISLMLLSAVCVTPASANWFSNPRTGMNLNIGSAPNPTPGDLRAIGDARYRPARAPALSKAEVFNPDLAALEGRTVYGPNGERLGYILAVDQTTETVELQTRGGVGVAMPLFLLVDRGNRMVAPTVTMPDVMDMARLQTGRTVAQVVDRTGRS